MDATTELSNLLTQKREWQDLQNNPAWQQLIYTLQAQADALQQQVLFSAPEGPMDLYKRERQLGELKGLLSVSSTVESVLQSLDLDIAQAQQRKEFDDVVD